MHARTQAHTVQSLWVNAPFDFIEAIMVHTERRGESESTNVYKIESIFNVSSHSAKTVGIK